MRLTTMSRYGTRAIFDIAYNSKGSPVQVKDVAERQQIPIKYLEQIFHKLKKADFIKSERGPGGGYLLTKDPHEIDLVACVWDSSENGTPCTREGDCVTRSVWKEAARLISEHFNSVTIADLCQDAKKKESQT